MSSQKTILNSFPKEYTPRPLQEELIEEIQEKINSGANTGTGIDTRTDNCFQVLNIGYVQISNNQPDLFAQTNAYGTASFSNVIAGGAWETGALAVTAYHYQDIRYWNQIYCWNANKFYKEAQDPYAIEKIFYHAFHDGPNAGLALLADIDANYTAAINATDMHDVISTGGTWANLGGGSSRKVANFTSLLDGGDGHLYDSDYVDGTQEYYGCYEEAIKWSDIQFYLDKIKILYPHVMDASVQADIKAVFDGLNAGNDVMFTNLGPVIDEIVIQMGGHDPSSYIATQYGASKTCSGNPIGVSLRTNDTICPGDSAELQVWLAGDLNFRVDIQFPDGSVNSYSNIDHSPYIIKVANPGDYEVVYFEDADEVGRGTDDHLVRQQCLREVVEEERRVSEAGAAIQVQGADTPRGRVAGDSDGRRNAHEEGLVLLGVVD